MTKRKPNELSKQLTGSPNKGEPVFIVVGKIRRPHGLRGDVLVEVWTDFPERLVPGLRLYVGENHEPLTIEKLRPHNQGLLVLFREMQNPEASGEYRNELLYVQMDEIPPLPEGEYYHHQMLGMRVVTDEGVDLGMVTQILETGSNDVYVVSTSTDGEILLPAIDSVILDIDLEHGKMVVNLLPGLGPA